MATTGVCLQSQNALNASNGWFCELRSFTWADRCRIGWIHVVDEWDQRILRELSPLCSEANKQRQTRLCRKVVRKIMCVFLFSRTTNSNETSTVIQMFGQWDLRTGSLSQMLPKQSILYFLTFRQLFVVCFVTVLFVQSKRVSLMNWVWAESRTVIAAFGVPAYKSRMGWVLFTRMEPAYESCHISGAPDLTESFDLGCPSGLFNCWATWTCKPNAHIT